MKIIIVLPLAIALFLATACAPRLSAPLKTPSDNLVIQNDEEEEYELIIIDPQFQTWFMTHGQPVNYYSKQYYEAKNRVYVTSWNEIFLRTGGRGPFENRINYDFSEDYGVQLNYELFWYFRYVESRFGRRYGFPT